MSSTKKFPLKMPLTILLLIVVYLIVSIPFKVMEIIPGFTDIRPVSMLEPVYGIFFGIPGCLAFAIGNLITDIVSDSLRWSSIAGFAANFAGPLCFYLFWDKLSRVPFDLRGIKNIFKHIAVILTAALIQAILITPAVLFVYPEVDHLLLFITIMINSTAFPILLGIPMLIILQEELSFKPYTQRTQMPATSPDAAEHKTKDADA